MADCVAIAPELPFRAQVSYMSYSSAGQSLDIQVTELATHLSRCVPTSTDPSASRDFIAGYESQLEEGEEEDESKRREVLKGIVGKVGEVGGALEGLKESGESFHHAIKDEEGDLINRRREFAFVITICYLPNIPGGGI